MQYQRNGVIILLLCTLALTGCGVDRSDPADVAKAFVTAVMNNDKEEAASFVLERERDSFMAEWIEQGEDFTGELPPLPDALETQVTVDQNEATVEFSNWGEEGELQLELTRHEGQWWISR